MKDTHSDIDCQSCSKTNIIDPEWLKQIITIDHEEEECSESSDDEDDEEDDDYDNEEEECEEEEDEDDEDQIDDIDDEMMQQVQTFDISNPTSIMGSISGQSDANR